VEAFSPVGGMAADGVAVSVFVSSAAVSGIAGAAAAGAGVGVVSSALGDVASTGVSDLSRSLLFRTESTMFESVESVELLVLSAELVVLISGIGAASKELSAFGIGALEEVSVDDVSGTAGVVSGLAEAFADGSGLYILKFSCESLAAMAIGIEPTEIIALITTGRTLRLIVFSNPVAGFLVVQTALLSTFALRLFRSTPPNKAVGSSQAAQGRQSNTTHSPDKLGKFEKSIGTLYFPADPTIRCFFALH